MKYSQKADTFTAKGEPTGKRISTSTCPSSTRATMTRAAISCGRPGTLFPANRAKMLPPGCVAINSNDGGSTLIGAKDPETGKPNNEPGELLDAV